MCFFVTQWHGPLVCGSSGGSLTNTDGYYVKLVELRKSQDLLEKIPWDAFQHTLHTHTRLLDL